VNKAQFPQDEQHRAHLQSSHSQQRRQQVGKDMAAEDLGLAEADGAGGKDEQATAQGEDVTADDLGDLAPADHRQGNDEGDLPAPDADGEHKEDSQDQSGDSGQELGNGRHGTVEEGTRPPATEGTQDETDEEAHGRGNEGHDEGLAGTVQKEGEHVAALVIRPKGILLGGRKGSALELAIDGLNPVAAIGVVRCDLGAEDGQDDEARHQYSADDEGPVAHGPAYALPKGLRFHAP
jgi:hypothetical protein